MLPGPRCGDGDLVLFRHAHAPGTGDPPGMRLGDCSTQRNLDETGRQQARRIARCRHRSAGHPHDGQARRRPYVINGTKTWITNAIEGSCFALLVKTDPEAQPRHKGMSLFIAPKGAGLTPGRKLEKLGYKSIDSGELIADGYRLSADHLIGGGLNSTHCGSSP